MRHMLFALVALCTIGFALSCQSHGPLTLPESHGSAIETPEAASPSTDRTSRYLWGYYRCAADLEQGTVSLLPNRSADLHLNATKVLNKTLGLGISIDPGSDPPAGYFLLTVTITHPYSGQLQLTGFDVRGIMLCTGGLDADGLRIPGPDDPELRNADGWTRWWNPSEFTDPGLLGYVPGLHHIHPPSGPPDAMVNPYKLFGDALYPKSDVDLYKALGLADPYGRAVFRAGNANSRQYEIQFPVSGGPIIYFDYAIDASWTLPNPNPPVAIPADFPLHANCPEAFLVEPTVVECTLAGTPFGGAGSGRLVLSIEVWDWQGWHSGSYADQIGNVRLYSPYFVFNTPTVERVDGVRNTVLTVTATGIPTTLGTIPVIVEIPAPGTSWKQGWQAAPTGEIAAYACVQVEVAVMECTGDDNVTCDDAEPVALVSSTTGAVCMPHDSTDYYVFVVPTAKVMEGTITLDNFNYSDNDLILYDGCPGDPIDSALEPGTGTEVMNVGNLESGFYYVAVLPGETSGTDMQPYNLILDIHLPGGYCTPDDNNEYTTAWLIGLQDTDSDTVCAGGDIRDWYKVIVPANKVAGGMIYVHNDSTGDINIRVYDKCPGPPTFWSTNPGSQDEMVAIAGLGPGAHYIELYAQGSTPEGDRPVTLETDLIVSDYDCTTGDGNDSHLTADPISYTDVIVDTVCFPADPDWFAFTVPQGKGVSGTITLSGGMVVDNDLFLYEDPTDYPIESSAQAGVADEVITLELLGAGEYYIKAAAHPAIGGGDQAYTLTMSLEEQAVGDFDFLIHAHIIRKSDGSSPATSEGRVQADVNWADEFYSRWGGSFTLVEVSYIDRTSWLAATHNEIYQCHTWYKDKSGPINVYYVNSFPDEPNAAAYCRMDCRYYYQTHRSTYVAMSDVARNRVLAHELAHATAIVHDAYLLDYYSCAQLYQYYCPYPPNNSYCSTADRKWGNLMYWGVAGWNDPEDYWLSDYHYEDPAKPIESQLENWTYFHTNYPNSFPN